MRYKTTTTMIRKYTNRLCIVLSAILSLQTCDSFQVDQRRNALLATTSRLLLSSSNDCHHDNDASKQFNHARTKRNVGSIEKLPYGPLLVRRTITTRGGGGEGSKSTTTQLHALPPALVEAAAVSVPSFRIVALACLLPTLSGYYRREYTVSYSYGTAVAVTAALVLKALAKADIASTSLASVHALALVFYGIRLDLFLLYREACIPRFRRMRERIEDRAPSTRLQRTPFIVGCAALYGFLAAPIFLTAMSPAAWVDFRAVTKVSSVQSKLIAILLGTTWFGFILAALGDLQKSWVKARKGKDALVTGGIFSVMRHPNYTGEIVGWVASALAGAVASWPKCLALRTAPKLLCTGLGVVGIVTVLIGATTSLEKRQSDKYSDLPEYQNWVKSSWVGFAKKPTAPVATTAESDDSTTSAPENSETDKQE